MTNSELLLVLVIVVPLLGLALFHAVMSSDDKWQRNVTCPKCGTPWQFKSIVARITCNRCGGQAFYVNGRTTESIGLTPFVFYVVVPVVGTIACFVALWFDSSATFRTRVELVVLGVGGCVLGKTNHTNLTRGLRLPEATSGISPDAR